jgi:diguanylate cyclase (GGDEF)-like protein/PAS domain S-box-containing protein
VNDYHLNGRFGSTTAGWTPGLAEAPRVASTGVDGMLRAIVDGLSRVSGAAFFRCAAEITGQVLGATYAGIGEVSPDGERVRLSGAWVRQGAALPSEYEASGTPAQEAARGATVHYARNLRASFPDDPRLARLYAESYIGIPVLDAGGDVLGIIELIFDRPLDDAAPVTTVLLALAGRAAAEIERDQAEAALRDSETRYRALIEDSFNLVAEVVDERYVYVSAGYTDALGYAPEDLLGGSVYDQLHPDDRRTIANQLQAALSAPTAAHFTARMRHRNGEWRWIETSARAFRASGGDYRTTLFSRDVTERRQEEESLRQSAETFRGLVKDLHVGVVLHDAHARVLVCNDAALDLLGLTEDEVLGKTSYDDGWHPLDEHGAAIPPDQRLVPRAIALKQPIRDFVFGIRRTARGDNVWILASAEPQLDESGAIQRVVVSMSDITGRLAAERELRESEARFRLLAEHSTDVIARYTPDGVCTWISPSVESVSGYRPEELIGIKLVDLFPPEETSLLAESTERIDGGTEKFTTTFAVPHRDGHAIWMEATNKLIRDETGRFVELLTASREITARKLAEDNLRESEARFRLLAEHATDMIARWATDGTCLWISPSVRSLTGYEPDELIGKSPEVFINPEDRPSVWEAFLAMVNGEAARTSTFRLRRKDGREIWVESAGQVIRDDEGNLVEIQSSTRDITERKRADDGLRESEARFRLLAENAADIIARLTPDGVCLWISPSVTAIVGYEPKELIGQNLRQGVHPEDLDAITQDPGWERPDSITSVLRYRHKDGRYIWLETTSKAIRDPGTGAVIEIHNTSRDVTARREAEDALRQSEERYRLLSESSPLGVYETDARGQATYFNGRAIRMSGMTEDEMLGSGWSRYIHPDDRERVEQAWREAIEQGAECAIEYRLAGPSGARWVFSHAIPVRDEAGAIERYVGTVGDVTERRAAEEALRQSEARFRSLAEHSSDLVLGGVAPDIIDYVSPNSEAILGYGPEHLLHTHALDLVHDDDRPAVVAEFQEAATSGSPAAVTARVRHQDGGWRWLEMAATFYGSGTGQMRAVLTARDVTERKIAEDALRESEERLRTVISGAPLVLVALDPQGTIVLAEGQGLDIIGVDGAQIAGLRIDDVFAQSPAILANLRRALDGEELSAIHAIGDATFEAHLRPVRDARGTITGVLGVAYDVTARVHAEAALRDSEETARALLNAPTDAAVLVDRDGTILALNHTAEARFRDHAASLGVEASQLVGTCVFDLFPRDLRAQRKARNDEVFEHGERRHFEDERDGVWTDVTLDPIHDAGGEVVRLAIFSRDITDRKRDEAALRKRSRELEALNDYLEKQSAELEKSQVELREASEQLADLLEAEQVRSKTDPLTGALNHGAISDVVTEAIAAEVALAVAMVDVDGMKSINDTYGHQAGDQVLLEVAKAITRGGAIAGRYGGDEFLVALLNATREEAEAYKAAVDNALRSAVVTDTDSGARVPVVASVGTAIYPDDADTLNTLIERADERMYEEKKLRRGTGLSSSREFGDERVAPMVGELVPLLTGEGTLDEKLRLVAHRVAVGGGYAGVNFDVFSGNGEGDGDLGATVNQNAFSKAPEEILDAWNRHQRQITERTVSEIVRQTRRPFVIDEIATSEYVTDEQKELLGKIGIRSGLVVPLFDGEDLIAMMSVGASAPAGFSARDVRFLGEVAEQVAAVVRLAQLVERLRVDRESSSTAPSAPGAEAA